MRPVPHPVSFDYGRRYRTGKLHRGVDFGCPYGTTVKAMRAGRVTHVGMGGWGPAYGFQVIVKTRDGRYEQYAHLSSATVKEGATVTAGQTIAKSGGVPKYSGDKRAGNSTGPHLHVQLNTSNYYTSNVNPWPSIDWKPTAPTTPDPTMLETSLYTQNCASRKADWLKRAPILARRMLAADASFIVCQELYLERRPTLDRLLADRYKMLVAHKGKVIYVRLGRWSYVANSARKFSLGNEKHGCSIKARHDATGKRLNVVCAHLSYRVHDGAKRASEARSLIRQTNSAYPDNDRTVYGGDWNETRNGGVDLAFKADGKRDAEDDVKASTDTEPNSFHGFAVPYPTGNWQIDGMKLGDGQATRVKVDAYHPPYGSDHFGVLVKFRFKK